MFGKPFRIGRVLGIDLTLSWSFLVLVAGLSFLIGLRSGSFLLGLLSGVLSLSLVFASVLVHELSHAIVARRLGVGVHEIELHFFGGAAKMTSAPRSPRDEILIAAAGPAASFLLGAVFWSLSSIGVELAGMVGALTSVNLMLGAFNLIPALPTDGGRILRAALAMRLGHLEGTRAAVKVARVATVGLGLYGLATAQIFVVGIAVFLWMLGTRELRLAEWAASMGVPNPYSGFGSPERYGAGQVEVFDRRGRMVGIAPGGAVEARPAASTTARPRTVPRFDAWGGGEPSAARPARRVVVQGPDGRLWVVSRGEFRA